jgi:hypothetical protein
MQSSASAPLMLPPWQAETETGREKATAFSFLLAQSESRSDASSKD